MSLYSDNKWMNEWMNAFFIMLNDKCEGTVGVGKSAFAPIILKTG